MCSIFLSIWICLKNHTLTNNTLTYIYYQNHVFIFSYTFRSSHPEVFPGKGVLKICSKFAGEHLCRSVISIKFLCNFIEIALRHECSPVNLLHIFRPPFHKNTSGWLHLHINTLIVYYHNDLNFQEIKSHVCTIQGIPEREAVVQRCSVKKCVLRNFTKFTGKHLCQSLFFNKVPGQACNFIKKESGTGVFL